MVAIIDYGVGNLFSLRSSLERLGAEVCISGEPKILGSAEKLFLPGVGAFKDAAEKLRNTGLDKVIKEQAGIGKPIMGICLGMQLLFDKSYEYGESMGLGLIHGNIVPMSESLPNGFKIPHIGWNELQLIALSHPLFKYIQKGEYVYFVHSFYAADCEESVIAETEYGIQMTAAAANKNVVGCQFHPEKSGDVGLRILKAFLETEKF